MQPLPGGPPPAPPGAGIPPPPQQRQFWGPGMLQAPEHWHPRRAARWADAMEKLQQQLMKKLPFRRVYYKTLRKGSLIYAKYLFWKHDPSPLVVVTDVFADRIRGINLHYLTFKYVKTMLTQYCGKAFFSYRFIMHDAYIVNAFRTYKKAGLRNLQLLDCDQINLQFQERRRAYKYNPQEMKAIREQLRHQLAQLAHPRAEELAKQYAEMLATQEGFEELSRELRQDARRAYRTGVPYGPPEAVEPVPAAPPVPPPGQPPIPPTQQPIEPEVT